MSSDTRETGSQSPRDLSAFVAALADRYTIERELGRGGMATVFLARDRRHERPVAIKVVRDDLAASLGAERFLKEIRTTAGLQHPHILPLLDSGEAAERLYYVMPFVEGETLRARLDRAGALPLAESVRLAGQIASALEHAHRRNVVHRDLKPENVLLADGLPVVADFGIALAVEHAGGDRLTAVGVSLGTPAYMSPEQVTGTRDVDGRSDQYALACVCFEMIAGREPFRGATVQGTMVEHVTAPIPTVTSPHGPVPAPLAAALRRALAKDPAERFASVAEFGAALQAAVVPNTTERPAVQVSDRSIVVLPLENLSPDPNDAFFADGLHEEITSDLSKVHALRVISRTSAMRMKGSGKDVPTIGRELGVRYVLEGSVRRAGNSVRVTAQLIDATNDAHMWSEKYSGTLDDVFAIQEKLAREIVAALRVTLTADESRRVGTPRLKDAQAYDCYLRARQLTVGGTPQSLETARALLQRAMEISGENALLLAAEALRLTMTVQNGVVVDARFYEQALTFAERALKLDPDCVEALIAMGITCKARGEIARGVQMLRRVLEIEPNQSDAGGWLTCMLAEAGRDAEALELAQRMVTSNPYDPVSVMWRGVAQMFAGQHEEALASFEEAHRTDPSNWWFLVWLASVNLLLDRPAEARRWVNLVGEANDSETWQAWTRLMLKRMQKQREDSPYVLTVAHKWRIDGEGCYFVATSLADLGDKEGAVDWLRSAVALGIWNLPFLTRHDRFLASLRGYAPFDDLMTQLEPRWRSPGF